MHNADLTRRLKEASKPQRRTSGNKEKLSDDDQLTARFAKHFGIMNEPFVPPAAFTVRPQTNSIDSGRYLTDTSKLQGITAELYEHVPEEMHEQINSSPAFQKLVRTNQDLHHTFPSTEFENSI